MIVGLPFDKAVSRSTAPFSKVVKVTGDLARDNTATTAPAATAPPANRARLSVATASLTGGGACDWSEFPVQAVIRPLCLCRFLSPCHRGERASAAGLMLQDVL